jgi:hypothetical protein
MIGVIVGSIALATSLSGCLLPIDDAKTYVQYKNNSSQDVVVIIEGFAQEYPQLVTRQSSYPYGLDECGGTGIRVETKSGELIGRVDKQTCPDWTLTVNEDDSLDYVKDK